MSHNFGPLVSDGPSLPPSWGRFFVWYLDEGSRRGGGQRPAETASHSKCAFFFCGLSAAIFGPLAALSKPGHAVGPIRVADQQGW